MTSKVTHETFKRSGKHDQDSQARNGDSRWIHFGTRDACHTAATPWPEK